MSADSQQALSTGLAGTGWTMTDLWVASVGVGGNLSQGDVRDIVTGARASTPMEHDVLAATLNELYTDRGQDQPVPYWGDLTAE